MVVETSREPQIGQFVRTLRGRDHDKYAIIVQLVDQRYVLIADGSKRKFDKPKRKNVLHLELMGAVSSEVRTSLQESGRVTNAKLRYALNSFVQARQSEAQEKGE